MVVTLNFLGRWVKPGAHCAWSVVLSTLPLRGSWLCFSSVQSFSCVRLCNPMDYSTPGFPVHHQLPEFTQTHIHRVGDAIQPSHPLSSPSPPAPNPSQHQSLFQWVNSLHEVAKVLSFSFSISPSNEHPRLISFRMDWLELLAVQGMVEEQKNIMLYISIFLKEEPTSCFNGYTIVSRLLLFVSAFLPFSN